MAATIRDEALGKTDASTERMPRASALRSDPLVGSPYRAVALIGCGPQAEVYRAEHVRLGTTVAVKMMRQPLAEAPALAERMRLESQALARLAHPNLVRVLDVGTVAGRAYFVMDHLVGRTLKEELSARRSLSVAEALDVALQALAGLELVHASGLVHRDLHPGNLFLCEADPEAAPDAGRLLKLLDFDLLKLVSADKLGGLALPALPTAAATSLGDERYAAPEQLAGRPCDGRTDLYSLALILYRMLAGREPFAHLPALADVLQAKLRQQPAPPSHWAPIKLDPVLDAIVLRCLALDPAARPPDARALAEALAALAPTRRQRCSVAPDGSSLAAAPRPAGGARGWARTVAMDPVAEPAAERPGPVPETAVAGAGEGPLAAGAMFGRYRVERLVGQGAMGEVYLARGPDGEERAIKVLQLTARVRSDLAERFRREVELLSYIDHTHVVRFYEAGVAQLRGRATLWVALEYLAGRTLREVVRDEGGRIAPERLVRWGRQIAQGVHEAHKLGVIHRDLKPENVSIVQGDLAKVFDFGIAKYRAWGIRATELDRKLGTLPYMSPEQLDGMAPVDARSDVFALGVMLHELATGRHPFGALGRRLEAHEAIFRQITTEAPPLSALVAGFPESVSAVVSRALAKQPGERFQSMAQLDDALGDAMRTLRAGARAAAVRDVPSQPPPMPPGATAAAEIQACTEAWSEAPAPGAMAAPLPEAWAVGPRPPAVGAQPGRAGGLTRTTVALLALAAAMAGAALYLGLSRSPAAEPRPAAASPASTSATAPAEATPTRPSPSAAPPSLPHAAAPAATPVPTAAAAKPSSAPRPTGTATREAPARPLPIPRPDF